MPPLRFPEFTDEWRKLTIDDICSEFQSGKFIRADVIQKQGAIPVYGGNGLRGYTDTYNHVGDYVLIGRQGALCGNVRFVTDKTYITEHAIAVKGTNDNNTKFLQYLFEKMNLGQYSDQSAQPGLAVNKLLKLKISIPYKNEQQKIAKLLHLLDERITTQSGLIEKLESLISGICKQFHDKTENWIQVSFIELGEDYSGLTNKSAGDFGKGKPYITYLNVNTNHIIDESQIQYVSVADDEKQNKVHWGDVIFTLSSETPDEVAVGSVYLGNCDELYLNSFCFGIHIVNEQYIYQPYLSYFISSPQFRKWVFPLAQGSTRFNLQKADFMKKKFLLPPIKEQKKLYDSLSTISKRVVIESSILSKLQLLKLYLLQQMFI